MSRVLMVIIALVVALISGCEKHEHQERCGYLIIERGESHPLEEFVFVSEFDNTATNKYENYRVSLSVVSWALPDFLKVVSDQTGCIFLMPEAAELYVKGTFSEVPLSSFMDQLVDNSDYVWSQHGDIILISKKSNN